MKPEVPIRQVRNLTKDVVSFDQSNEHRPISKKGACSPKTKELILQPFYAKRVLHKLESFITKLKHLTQNFRKLNLISKIKHEVAESSEAIKWLHVGV